MLEVMSFISIHPVNIQSCQIVTSGLAPMLSPRDFSISETHQISVTHIMELARYTLWR